MEQHFEWQYCESSTMRHHLSACHPDCIKDLSEVISKDGGKNSPFSNEKVLNLDEIERKLAKKQKRSCCKTVDVVFCIKKQSQTNIVLVELRLNYNNVRNLSKTELDEKIKYSKQLVTNDIQIYNRYYFIFSKETINQAYHYIRKLYSNKQNYIALDIHKLKDLFFIIS